MIVENGGMSCLDREDLLSAHCFKVDIIAIWEFKDANNKKFKLWNRFRVIEGTKIKLELILSQVSIALSK